MASALALGLAGPALAFDVDDRLAVHLLAAWGLQCQRLTGRTDATDTCRGAAPLQPAVSYEPTGQERLFAKLAFAAGDGLNGASPFALSPWYVDLNSDVHHVNGRGWSGIQEIWYGREVQLAGFGTLRLLGGIVDPTPYLDDNTYANDAFTQFMNQSFVNARNTVLPAHDWGGVLVWKVKDWTMSAAGMNVGENEDGNNYNFYGVQAGFRIETAFGEGHYRMLYAGTSRASLDPSGQDLERRSALSLSFDQALGGVVGAFLRLGWQTEAAAVDYGAAYSAGLDIRGTAWGRGNDNIGVGYAYLDGGNLNLKRSDVLEAYYRWVVNDGFALTADIQYMEDRDQGGGAVAGWVLGARAVVTL